MLTSDNWPTDLQGYRIGTPIGAGAYGTVHSAVVALGPKQGQRVAIKILDLEKFPDSNLEEINREIQIMRFCHHPNVVSYYVVFLEMSNLYMVMPILEGGSLGNIIRTQYPAGINDEALLATILRETLQGINYFHQNNQIHRDIKAGNILVAADGKVLIGDFGVAAKLKQGINARTFVGSPCWIAPEVIDNENFYGYDQKADIWSFGITAIELLMGRPPLYDLPPMKVIVQILHQNPPQLTKQQCNNSYFRSLVNSCLQKNPTCRPSAEELLQNKFFRKARESSFVYQSLLVNLPPLEQRINMQSQVSNFLNPPSRPRDPQSSVDSWDFSLSGDYKGKDPLEAYGSDNDDSDVLDQFNGDD